MFTNVYSNDGTKCPKVDQSFTTKIEFYEQSNSTIVTKVEQKLTAVDTKTGLILFNLTKAEFLPHFNQLNE